MNSDNFEGTARGAAGKVQEAFGDITGDTKNKVEGMGRQVAGRAQEAYGDAKDAARNASQQVGEVVQNQPVVSLLVAGVVGFALGILTIGMTSRRW